MTYLKPFFKFPISKLYSLFLISMLFVLSSAPVWAEGSKELNANGGHRAYLVYGTDNVINIPLASKIYAYAEDGETIHLGSSAMGTNPGTWEGKIEVTAPNGTSKVFENADNGGTCGTIANYDQEQDGPASLIPLTTHASSGIKLAVNVTEGGAVNSSETPSPNINGCSYTGGTCIASYTSGDLVTLTATPNTGYTFVRWEEDCSGSTNSFTVTMNSAKTCNARFAGYDDCTIDVTSATEGVWQIKFVSPNPSSTANQISGPPLNASDPWVQENNVRYLAAWDVTVSNNSSGTATAMPGRVYANYLAINMGNQNANLNAKTFVQTYDGSLYSVDLNGIQPFLGVFFSNNSGFLCKKDENKDECTDTGEDTAMYRSLQFALTDDNFGSVPPNYSIHLPNSPDSKSASKYNITQKLFFNQPDSNLPENAPVNGGTTWLNPEYIEPTIPDLSFEGIDGTPGQMGTQLGGKFKFNNVNNPISYSIRIDVDRDGTYGNNNDRIIVGTAGTGANSVLWDGRDGNGVPVPAGTTAYKAIIEFNVGEVHFPFIDAEYNANGFIIERISQTDKGDTSLIYYDDRYTTNKDGSSNDSLCAVGDGGTTCLGIPPSPRQALDGIDSRLGAHTWKKHRDDKNVRDSGVGLGFGDRRGIDTWTYIPYRKADSKVVEILALEADLAITKSAPTVNGANISYTIVVTNNGTSNGTSNLDANNLATVTDQIPSQITNVNWSCTITGTGACTDSSGTGNNLNTTVWLQKDAKATFTISGQLATTSTAFTNTATVTRPHDVNDPIATNNTASSSYTPPETPPDNPPPPPDNPNPPSNNEDKTEVKLRVNITVGEGNVTSTPVGIDCDSSTPAEPDENICEQTFNPNNATEVILTPNPAPGYAFSHWTGNSDCLDGIVTMDRNLQCYAVFKPVTDPPTPPPVDNDTTDEPVDLTVTVIGHGTVNSAPSQFDCTTDETCVETYEKGAQVTLIPTPEPGWLFQGWEEDCTTTATLAMTTDKICKAIFVPDTDALATLNITIEGEGGVASSPIGIDCGDVDDCTEDYLLGSHVELTATPRVGWEFVGWSGDCSGLIGNPVIVKMETSKNCTAIFQKPTLPPVPEDYPLSVDIIGKGGVTSNDKGIACVGDCIENYTPETLVTLTAVPEEGYRFKAWSGHCSGTNSIVTVTMNAAKECTATFEIIPVDDYDGVPGSIENDAPNNGDGNNDGTLDSEQNHVVSLPTPEGHYVTVEVSDNCSVENIRLSQRALPPDGDYYYPYLLDYFLDCPNTEVTVYHHGYSNVCDHTCRQYAPLIPGLTETSQWQESSMVCGTTTLDGQTVATTTFTLTDGGTGDSGNADGKIFHTSGCGTQPGCLAFVENSLFVDEFGNATTHTASVKITREGDACEGAVSVDYATQDNTATQKVDYLPAKGTLNWTDGDCDAKTISVSILDDILPEGDEMLNILFSNPSGIPFCDGDKTVLTIKDNEAPSSSDNGTNTNNCYNLPTCNVCCNGCQTSEADGLNAKTIIVTIEVGDTIDILLTEGTGQLLLKEVPDSTFVSLDSWKTIGSGTGQVTLTGVQVGSTKMTISDSTLAQVATIYVNVIESDDVTDVDFGIRAMLVTLEVGQSLDVTVAGGQGALSLNKIPSNQFVALDAWTPLSDTGAADFTLRGLQVGETEMLIHDNAIPPQKVTVTIRVIPTETPSEEQENPPTDVTQADTNEALEDLVSVCEIGNALAINVHGQVFDNDSCFAGVVRNHGKALPNHSYFSHTAAQDIEIVGAVKVDPLHVGQAADILLVGVYQTLTSQRDYMRDGENWRKWDKQLSTLQSAGFYEQLPETFTIPIFTGDLSRTAGEFTVFMGYRLKDGTIVYNGIEPIHFFVGNSVSLDPTVGTRLDAEPPLQQVATYFEPFVHNFEGYAGNNLIFVNRDLLSISTFVRVDPQHVGKMVDILMVAVHKRSLDQVEYTRDSQAWTRWDKRLDSLQAVERYLQLPETLEIPVYLGELANVPGEFVIYVGYRTEDGVITYNGIELIHFTVANGFGLNENGQSFETTARFASWIYQAENRGNPFQTQSFESFGIGVNIIPDPAHIGETANIIMIAVNYPQDVIPSTIWNNWDEQWVSFQNTLPNVMLESVLREIPLFDGQTENYMGNHTVYVGYQLENGTLVYNGGEMLYFNVRE